MAIRQLPSPRWTIPGNSGVVAAGYYVYTYQPGTSTPKATYTDHTGSTPNTNPIVLDARGEANIWWDGQYKVLAYTGDKDAGGVLVWSQDNYGEGTSAVLQGNFNLVLNGSFEQDTNGDDLPDDWTIVEYADGQVERDSLEQIHGSYSLKFTSVGTGGGYADSTLFEVQEARVLPVSFALKSSIATVHNQVDVVWYTAAGAVLSTTTLYDDATTNPTDWTTFNYSATPPTNARFGKVRIFGCKDDNAQPGSVWFDNVVSEAASIAGLFPNVNSAVTVADETFNTLVPATATPTQNRIPISDQPDGRLAWGWKPSYRGCKVYKSSAQTIPNNDRPFVAFDLESFDTDSIHDNATDNYRLTVPSGVTKVRLTGQVSFGINSTGNRLARIHAFYANEMTTDIVAQLSINATPTEYTTLNLSTSVIDVSGGDYFYMRVQQTSGVSLDIQPGSETWLTMDIVE